MALVGATSAIRPATSLRVKDPGAASMSRPTAVTIVSRVPKSSVSSTMSHSDHCHPVRIPASTRPAAKPTAPEINRSAIPRRVPSSRLPTTVTAAAAGRAKRIHAATVAIELMAARVAARPAPAADPRPAPQSPLALIPPSTGMIAPFT
jgi:hypothetical protein